MFSNHSIICIFLAFSLPCGDYLPVVAVFVSSSSSHCNGAGVQLGINIKRMSLGVDFGIHVEDVVCGSEIGGYL